MRRRFLLPLLLLSAAACTTAGAATSRPRTNSAVLTTDELKATQHLSMLALIRAERPHWLRTSVTSVRGSQGGIIVYQDNLKLGSVDLLEMIRPATVYSARYFSPSEAEGRFGVGHESGVIQILTVPGR